MIRDRSWAESTACVGKSRQAPHCDPGQLGLRKNHKRVSNRNSMRQLHHLGWANCWANCLRWPPGHWLLRITNHFFGPQKPLRTHIHSTPSTAVIFYLPVTAPGRCHRERQRQAWSPGHLVPWKNSRIRSLPAVDPAIYWVCVLGHIFLFGG